VNQNIRTISRLIVHPAYRGLGLASILIKCILNNCTTRYTETLATMAKAHPLFRKSGMKEFPPAEEYKPHYYLFDAVEDRKSKIEDQKFISPLCENSCKAIGHK
jgi:ABC-type ATPase with predicted acetyltransferase domain